MLGLSELRQSLHGFLIGTHVVMPFFTAALVAEDCSFIPMSNAVALNSAISSPTPAANCPCRKYRGRGSSHVLSKLSRTRGSSTPPHGFDCLARPSRLLAADDTCIRRIFPVCSTLANLPPPTQHSCSELTNHCFPNQNLKKCFFFFVSSQPIRVGLDAPSPECFRHSPLHACRK